MSAVILSPASGREPHNYAVRTRVPPAAGGNDMRALVFLIALAGAINFAAVVTAAFILVCGVLLR